MNRDEAVLNLRHLSLQHTLQEVGRRAAQDDAGLAAGILHAEDDGASGFAFAEEVARNHFLAWQEKLVAFLVHEECLALPCLIDFGTDDLALAFLIFIIEGVVLQLHDAAGKGLPELQDGTAAEFGHLDALADLFVHLIVVLYLLCLAQRDFLVGVGHFAVGHNDAVVVNLKVALVGIDDDVVVLVGAVHLGDNVAEAFLQHAHEGSAVDVVFLFEVGENLNHVLRHF